MAGLIWNELVKISGKWRSAIGFIAIGALMPLILWGFSIEGESVAEDLTEGLSGSFLSTGSLVNGLMVTYIVMNFLWVHLPFLVMLVAGDAVAGEGASGTLRIYLTRPVSRARILSAKLAATLLYLTALVAFAAVMSLGLGTLWLGVGDLLVSHEGFLLLSPDMAWPRFALAFLLACITLSVSALLCFMFSTFTNNAIGPIVGAMATLIFGLAVGSIPLDLFRRISPYLFTHHLDLWQRAFYDPIPWGDIGRSLLSLAAYSGAFVATSYAVFLRKDVRS